jgi:hypothetical protein
MREEITDLQDAENRGYLIGFEACARIQNRLDAAAFFFGVLIGLSIAAIIAGSI